MTEDDKRPFFAELKRMGLAFSRDDVDAPLAAVYFDALADLDWRTVQIAMRDCVESMSWLPRPADIRDAEVGVRMREQTTQQKQLIARAPDMGAYFCTACTDTGFVRDLDCPGDGRCHVAHCGQPGHASYAHSYTRKCHCRATNPVLVKARETLRALATRTSDTGGRRGSASDHAR